MPIFPEKNDLHLKWQIAALDLPIPDTFESKEDMYAWSKYAEYLSPSQKVRKFGQALDQLYTISQKENDLNDLTEKDKELLCAKRDTVMTLAIEIYKNFEINTQKASPDSTIVQATCRLIDFLRSVNSADAPAWEDRAARHKRIEEKVFDLNYRWSWDTPPPPNSKGRAAPQV